PTLALVREVIRAPALRFIGLHAYEGHVVQESDHAVRKAETERMLAVTMDTRHLIEHQGIDVVVVTCGGTRTYDLSGGYPGGTDHQSGSYVYMDPGYTALT